MCKNYLTLNFLLSLNKQVDISYHEQRFYGVWSGRLGIVQSRQNDES